jgi:5-methylcytosine-specific restriction endonuclease McrA
MTGIIHRPCQHPGCGEYAAPHETRCPPHVRIEDGKIDRKGKTLYRSAAWRRVRREVLKAHPWCQAPDCTNMAFAVDHIVPLREGGAKLARSNLQALCARHHSQKTIREVIHRKA